MVAGTKLKNGIFEDKVNLLEDVSNVYKGGLYSDITLILNDKVSVSTNRFMLACRIPYFATMLFGHFEEESSVSVPLECCTSYIFKLVLDFVWNGEIQFSEMPTLSIFHLLETARFLCIDLLVEGIMDYLKFVFESQKVEFKDALVALDFSLVHKFSTVSNFIVVYIDQNLTKLAHLPEFKELSDSSMMMLLNMEKKVRISSETALLQAFVKWHDNKEDVPANVKQEMINSFALEDFSNIDLKETVRKSKLFSDEDMCDVLESRLHYLEAERNSYKTQIKSHNNQIELNERRISKQVETITKQRTKIEEQKSVRIGLIHKNSKQIGEKYRMVWKMNNEHWINRIEFTVPTSDSISYTLNSSLDGRTWNDLRNVYNADGKQKFHFVRRKMKYVALDFHKGSGSGTVENVFAVMI